MVDFFSLLIFSFSNLVCILLTYVLYMILFFLKFIRRPTVVVAFLD